MLSPGEYLEMMENEEVFFLPAILLVCWRSQWTGRSHMWSWLRSRLLAWGRQLMSSVTLGSAQCWRLFVDIHHLSVRLCHLVRLGFLASDSRRTMASGGWRIFVHERVSSVNRLKVLVNSAGFSWGKRWKWILLMDGWMVRTLVHSFNKPP